jgi:hypothetical protein
MRPLSMRESLGALYLLLVALLPPSLSPPSIRVHGPFTAVLPSVLFTSAASWASPSATFVDGPLLSVQSLNVSGALHISQMNVEAKLTAMQSQIDALTALLTELSGRMTAAEQLSGSPPSPLVLAVTSQAATLTNHATRLSAAENLNGTATPLTTAVQSVRDLSAGSPITDALIGMRDLSITTTPLASTLMAVRNLTSGTPLYSAVNGMRTLTAGTPLTDTLIAIRDFTPTAFTGYTTLNGLKSLTAGTVLTDAVLAQGTRITAAENLNGVATSLTDTVKQVRDFTSGTPLYTAVNNMRTLVAGSNLTDTLLALRDGTGNSALVTSLHSLQNHSACCGTTPPGNTNWQVYGGGGATNYVDVSLASCGFTAVPTVLSTLTGSGSHAWSIGATSPYTTTPTSFRVYITALTPPGQAGTLSTSSMTPGQFNTLNWAVAWCAFV